ncbi:MAG: ABC transporter permease, partial [Mesorhizobium sp.]
WLGRTTRLSQPPGERLGIQLTAAATALASAVIVLALGRLPDLPLLDFPALQGLNLKGGLRIPPEFSALAIAIAIYGGSY